MERGICKLCLLEKDLQNSHFIGQGVYRRLYDRSLPNPRPILFTTDEGKQTDEQIKDYVFCWDCEQIFNRRGENFVHPRIATKEAFPLLKMFTGRRPLVAEPGYKLYDGNTIPGLDCASLLHFGAGIFFKAAIHSWQFEGAVSKIEIGEYAEPLRKFLHDGADLPAQVAISMAVASDLPRFLGCFPPIPMEDFNGTEFKFYVSGIIYTLTVGENIPENFREYVFSAKERKLIYLIDEVSDVGRDIMKQIIANARVSPELEALARSQRAPITSSSE